MQPRTATVCLKTPQTPTKQTTAILMMFWLIKTLLNLLAQYIHSAVLCTRAKGKFVSAGKLKNQREGEKREGRKEGLDMEHRERQRGGGRGSSVVR